MDAVWQDTLAAALGIGDRSCVAFVGAGGKTTALRRLCAELAAAGRRVIATTTTAMFRSELAGVGPVLVRRADARWAAELGASLAADGAVAVVAGEQAGGKARGLSREAVDELWASGLADHVVVEADGSRGLPLKAFGRNEPQVPAAADLVVVLAGLDALGAPLLEDHVHRAGLLAALVGMPMGAEVTPAVVAGGVRAQVARVTTGPAVRRRVILLNKAESVALIAAGGAIAADLLEGASACAGQSGEAGVPDAVVVGSLRDGTFRVVAGRASTREV